MDSSVFQQADARYDTVWFAIYPDDVALNGAVSPQEALQSLHLEILRFLAPLTSDYIWQHGPYTLSPSPSPPLPHLHGRLRFGDNLDDEWFLVSLLFELSRAFPSLSVRVWDSDGDFLLIEAAFHLPRWLDPETSPNRVFIRKGELFIVPRTAFPETPSVEAAVRYLVGHEGEARAEEGVRDAVGRRIEGYPEKAGRDMHRVRVRVPVRVARVLREEPCLISLAVEGFYDRDVDTMKHAARMERFLGGGKEEEEEMVVVAVRMSRAMYAQLVQQKFQAPKCYPMPRRDSAGFLEAELGMKITCGFEMMYQQRRKEGEEGKGEAWRKYVESLEKSGYFEGLLPGSVEYKRLMHNAEEYYRNSSLFQRTSEMLSAPVRRIDEILALPYSAEEFKCEDVPPSDDDSWLYNGEEELNVALQERQEEMDLYMQRQKKNKKSKNPQGTGPSSSSNFNNCDPGNMAKAMQAFVDKVSSYKGAEVPKDRELKDVDLDVERFLKDMDSVMKTNGGKDNASDIDFEDGSGSDMDFDDFGDEDDMENDEDGEDTFMDAYSSALNEQLKNTTLEKSFVRADDKSSIPNEGTSNSKNEIDEEFTPVDVDFNLVKSLLDSFSSQQGQPGPASNLLGLMGLKLPQDSGNGK